MVEKAKAGSGWVDYVSEHPKTKLPEEKTTYIEGVGDIFFGCGIYKK
jgi:signal transduction histidine kinase